MLGSTGSIGTQTLDIVAEFPDRFRVVALSAGNNLALLVEQIQRHAPEAVALADPSRLGELQERLTALEPSQRPPVAVVIPAFLSKISTLNSLMRVSRSWSALA